MGLLDQALSTFRRSQGPSGSAGAGPYPELNTSSSGQTAQSARASGGMSPEAAAYNAQPKGAFPATAAAKPTFESRLSKIGNANGMARVGGGLQGALAANSMVRDGVGVDNATDLASGAAKFAGPVGVVGSTAFDVGKLAGKVLMPDALAVGLAKAANVITGNSDRNRESQSTVGTNMDEIRRVAAENPNGATAKLLSGGAQLQAAAPKQPQTPQQSEQSPGLLQMPQLSEQSPGLPQMPQSSGQSAQLLREIVSRLANVQPSAGANRPIPTAVQQYSAPPALDTSMVAGDATGIATLAKIAAQRPKAAEWAAGMKRAKNQDALQQKYQEMDDENARAGDILKIQGLGKSLDILSALNQREQDLDLNMQRRGTEQSQDTEKRYDKRIETTFCPAFDKDGKPNEARQKFDTALNAYLDQAGIDKRQLDPGTFEKILLSSQSPAYNPSPGIGSQLLQKALGGSTAATANSMDATRPTGEQALGGVFVKTADGRYKLASDVHGGGTLTDIFNPPNREVQSRFAKEAAEAAKRRRGN